MNNLQWSRPYSHLVIMATFLARQNGHTFSSIKPLLMWPPVNKANGHNINSQGQDYH